MTLVAGEILDDAIAAATPFIAEYQVPQGSLLRVLGTYDLDAVRLVSIYAPERLSSAGATFSVDTALNLTGYPLSSGLSYHHFLYILEDGDVLPLTIVPESRHELTTRHPCGIVRLGGSQAEFFPTDPLYKHWEGDDDRMYFSDTTHQIAYRYVPIPARVTSRTQSLNAPDECRDYLQWMLTAYALEIAEAPPERRQNAIAHATLARNEFILLLAKRLPTQAAWGEPVQPNAPADSEERILLS